MNYKCVQFLSLVMGPLCLIGAAETMPGTPVRLKQERTYDSLGEAVQAALYGARPDGAGFAAPNPKHHFLARFSEDGLSLAGSDWDSSWEFRSIGYGERQHAVGAPRLKARGSRVELRRGAGIVEWYVNGARGLEQGFTLSRPPSERHSADRLRLTIDVGGSLKARAAGEDLELVAPDGSVALRYEHLTVTDANGRRLPSWMKVADGAVWLETDDTGATWPLNVDPVFVQQAYLKASNAGAIDLFGFSLGISGSRAVVGAFFESSGATGVDGNSLDDSAPDAGAAYVFVRTGTSWRQEAYLKASDTQAGALFGASVAISGSTVVVGAHNESAYVFIRNGATWSQQAILKASNPNAADGFGTSVALSESTIVVGAQLEDSSALGVNGNQADNSASASGAAYVFVRDGNTWMQQAYLKASNTEAGDHFGFAVAVSGDTALIGADQESSSATGSNGDQANNDAPQSGAAYVFAREGGVWTQRAYLKASNTDRGDGFGRAVSIAGATLAIGAPNESSTAMGVNGIQANNAAPGAGAVYVFSRHGDDWRQLAYLKASNPNVDDNFGISVAASESVIVVGAPNEDSSARGVNGDGSNNNTSNAGAAYVFVRESGEWSFRDYLKASNTASEDFFGISTAVSGNTAVVGAFGEDSNATVIDGDQNNALAPFAGAAYAFLDDSLCSLRLSHVSASIGPAGGPSSVAVAASESCTWTAVSNVPWITITAGRSGTGSGVVQFLVAASPGGVQRSGTLTIAGQTFTLSQTDANFCFFTLSPSSAIVTAPEGSGTIEVIAALGCSWTASSDSSWLRVTGPAAGIGPGIVQYAVQANPGGPRSGHDHHRGAGVFGDSDE